MWGESQEDKMKKRAGQAKFNQLERGGAVIQAIQAPMTLPLLEIGVEKGSNTGGVGSDGYGGGTETCGIQKEIFNDEGTIIMNSGSNGEIRDVSQRVEDGLNQLPHMGLVATQDQELLNTQMQELMLYPGTEVHEVEEWMIQPLTVMDGEKAYGEPTTDWLFEKIKDFCVVIGLSCEGYEDRLWKLLEAIEADRKNSGLLSSNAAGSKSIKKGSQELKRLEWSMKDEIRGDRLKSNYTKGRGNNGGL